MKHKIKQSDWSTYVHPIVLVVEHKTLWAHIYDDELVNIIGEFHQGKIGLSVDSEMVEGHIDATFVKVIAEGVKGWVATSALMIVDLD